MSEIDAAIIVIMKDCAWNIEIEIKKYCITNAFVNMIDENVVQQVWEKGIKVEGFDPSQVRKDSCGAFIVRTQYKNRNSDYGWEIDHVYPVLFL